MGIGFNKSSESNVSFKNLDYFYSKGVRLDEVPSEVINTSDATTMNYMFYMGANLTSLDVSNFNTSNVTGMQYMFYNCSNLTSLDVSNFNTSNVTTMNSMFGSCSNLTSLDVSNFNTSNVTDMQNMLNNCYNLTSLTLGENWISNDSTAITYPYKISLASTGIKSTYFTTFVDNLPDVSNDSARNGKMVMIYQTSGNGADSTNIANAKAKGWDIVTTTYASRPS